MTRLLLTVLLLVATTVSAYALPMDPLWARVGVGNFWGDPGATDILYRHADSGALHIHRFHRNDAGGTRRSFYAAIYPEWPWHWAFTVEGVGDFSGDGKSDILLRNVTNGEHLVWVMDGHVIVVWGTPFSVPLEWRASAVRDINGDGLADILWRQVGGAWETGYSLMYGTAPQSVGLLSSSVPVSPVSATLAAIDHDARTARFVTGSGEYGLAGDDVIRVAGPEVFDSYPFSGTAQDAINEATLNADAAARTAWRVYDLYVDAKARVYLKILSDEMRLKINADVETLVDRIMLHRAVVRGAAAHTPGPATQAQLDRAQQAWDVAVDMMIAIQRSMQTMVPDRGNYPVRLPPEPPPLPTPNVVPAPWEGNLIAEVTPPPPAPSPLQAWVTSLPLAEWDAELGYIDPNTRAAALTVVERVKNYITYGASNAQSALNRHMLPLRDHVGQWSRAPHWKKAIEYWARHAFQEYGWPPSAAEHPVTKFLTATTYLMNTYRVEHRTGEILVRAEPAWVKFPLSWPQQQPVGTTGPAPSFLPAPVTAVGPVYGPFEGEAFRDMGFFPSMRIDFLGIGSGF